MAIIYKLTNSINGLIYIGCTTKSLAERVKGHKSTYKRRNNDLYLAMREFGVENFRSEVIEEVDDSIRYDRERFWIAEFDSINPNIGYNRTIGGPGTIGYVFTEQDLKKKSENRKGKYKVTDEHKEIIRRCHKGKKISDEQRQKISESCKGRPSNFKGRHHTEESKALCIQSKKEHGVLKPVKGTNIVDGSVVSFDSIADATRFILAKRSGKYTTVISHIRNSIVGYQSSKSAYGYIWEYIEKSNDYPDRE